MQFYKNLNLKMKLILGFSLAFVFILVALFYGLLGLNSNSEQLNQSIDITTEANLANSIQKNLLLSIIEFKDFLSTGDSKALDTYNAVMKSMDEDMLQLENVTSNVNRKVYIKKINQVIEGYSEDFSRIMKLYGEAQLNYDSIAESGQGMLDELEFFKLQSEDFNNEDFKLYLASCSESLLYARLHASKFFDFHTEAEYELYQSFFFDFRQLIDGMAYEIDLSMYNEHYSGLTFDMEKYFNDMDRLHEQVLEQDTVAKNLDEIGPEVTNYVVMIIESVNKEQALNQTMTKDKNNNVRFSMGLLILIAIMVSIYVIMNILKEILVPIKLLNNAFLELSESEADTSFRLGMNKKDEIGEMASSFDLFMDKLGVLVSSINFQNWVKSAQNDMTQLVRDENQMRYLAERILTYMCNYTKGLIGSFYIESGDGYECLSTYAHSQSDVNKRLMKNEGYLGQTVEEKKIKYIEGLTTDDLAVLKLKISTDITESLPLFIVVIPCLFDNEVNGIIEIGFLRELTEEDKEFFEIISENIGQMIHSTDIRIKMKDLLDRTMRQAEELQMQQEELKQSNEELEEQTRALKESEVRLQAQQEELRVSNEELEERSRQLELQKIDLGLKNKAILASQEEILGKAHELEVTNRYKTEFLANMSHELRTPLNSILVLSQLLASRDNTKPLNTKEISFASTINSSGNDLLTLINGVLDLSKVEAGRLELHIEKLTINQLIRENRNLFEPLAHMKSIEFDVISHLDGEFELYTDSLRINQIIKNLLSNAIKFTHNGFVKMIIRKPSQGEVNRLGCIMETDIAIEITDSGIGVPEDKIDVIFEAFKQSDGTTSRNYGGTGLGLTISLEIARLMGGHILLESKVNEGSTFVLVVPIDLRKNHEVDKTKLQNEDIQDNKLYDKQYDKQYDMQLEDGIIDVTSDEKKHQRSRLLIIEDDKVFAQILADLATEKGYLVEMAHTGYLGLEFALENIPDGIILDMGLPDMDGMDVARKLGALEETKHIPIHIISGSEQFDHVKLPQSIIGFLKKPVDIKSIYQTLAKIEEYSHEGLKKLLVVGECGHENFDSFTSLGQIEVVKVLSGREGLELVEVEIFGCIVLDSKLEDMRGIEFLTQLNKKLIRKIPIVIYTQEALEVDEYDNMKDYTDSIILKSAKSRDRLTDEVNLFLHDMKSTMEHFHVQSSISKQLVQANVKEKIMKENALDGIKVLLVDDDDRNLFALTHALEQYGMTIIIANNGLQAIEQFELNNNLDIILMDIMMPTMDGYEAIERIRKKEKGSQVPIIALTAKAMKEDRNKCIQAGANDYMTKPMDIEKLISLMKVWLA